MTYKQSPFSKRVGYSYAQWRAIDHRAIAAAGERAYSRHQILRCAAQHFAVLLTFALGLSPAGSIHRLFFPQIMSGVLSAGGNAPAPVFTVGIGACVGATSSSGDAVITIDSSGMASNRRIYAELSTLAPTSTLTVTDSLNVSGWTMVRRDKSSPATDDFTDSSLWVINNPTVGATHVITFHSSSSTFGFVAACVLPVSGGTIAAVDSQNGGSGTGATQATGTLSPTHDNEIVVSGASYYQSVGSLTLTGTNTYTVAAQITGVSAQHVGVAIGYGIQGTATADNLTWGTISTATGFKFAVSAGTFQ